LKLQRPIWGVADAIWQVGIGAPNKTKDLESARKWYTLAAEKGSAEAKKRLDALQAAQPVVLGREEHEQLKV